MGISFEVEGKSFAGLFKQWMNGHWCCLCRWRVLFGWFTFADSNSIMQEKQKKKKKRRKKGLISRSALWGCLLRKCEGDGIGWQYAVWHHEGNWVTIMSDKVGWFFGPPGTYTASPFPLSTHTHTHTHAQGQRKIKLKREMICFSYCHVATVLLTFPFPYSILFFCFPPLWKHYLFGGVCWYFLSWCKKRILRPV